MVMVTQTVLFSLNMFLVTSYQYVLWSGPASHVVGTHESVNNIKKSMILGHNIHIKGNNGSFLNMPRGTTRINY